jgi:osmotically inducible protein OsmC
MEIRRSSSASWTGPVDGGSGDIRIGRSGPTVPFSLKTRIGEASATNPEELVAAALAGCYAMSLANELGDAGIPFADVDTSATVHLVQGPGGFSIPTIDLSATVVGSDESVERLTEVAQVAKANCPVSRLYDADVRLEVSRR